nr:putative ribonuclease H-like domain-containing protein [Tanacetum cinerariifolium]
KDISKSRGHRHSWNRKARFVCKSLSYLIKDCDYYGKKMVQRFVRSHAMRVYPQHSARITHIPPNRHIVPTAVLTRFKFVPLNAARPVSTAVPTTNVKQHMPAKHVVNKAHSPIRRPIKLRSSPKNSNFHQKVTTVKANQVNAVEAVKGNWGNPQHALKDKGVIASGSSRHMTGNISYLSDFEEINGGYVSFGGNPKGGKITGKGIKREFSIARTPQQNRVVERKNQTLIEAARTMLEDSLLPIPFWAEAVNTARYVQNRVLVTKPHNKTPYELLLGSRPKWLFDIDTLTQSMNYQTVVAGNQPNSIVCIQGNFNADPHNIHVDAAFDDKENESKVYVSPSSSDKPKKHDEKAKREAKGKSLVDFSTRVRDLSDEFEEFSVNSTNRVNAASAPVTAVGPNSTNNTNSFNAARPYNNAVYKVVKALYGLHQAPKAWDETLANYLLENGFQKEKIDQTLFIKKQKGDILLVQVYVDDIIFGSTNKELCKAFEKLMKDKFQMSSMGELTFFLRLQVKQNDNEIFISQDKYVAKILRKFGLTDGKSASTPIDTKNPLLKDPDGEDANVYIYRSMIGSLMYLTLSRPDIMFAVCACACFQVTPKVLHLHAVKKIFRYLKGKPHLGLWYHKDSPFNLVAYSDSDYAGASLDRKSTTGGCQFLGCRLISWQCKKQTVVATSLTKAEYVAAARCCAQVLWIQNQ